MNAFLSILSAIPGIIAAIKAIEAAVPTPGKGQAKLDAVLSLVQAADANLQQYAPQLPSVVSTLVGLFNKTGTFTK
jgi:hypothetical protein